MSKTGFSAADILLPAEGNYETWAVVACDQFTSQPEYWERVEKTVGDKPSTFRIILPEAQLSDGHTEEHINKINATMKDYLANGVFKEYPDAMIYLERVQSDGKVRKGLIGKIDLEEYDYSVGSTSLVRATEGTVLDRIPPRQAVRRDAAVELPHVMLLIDDVDDTVIGPLKGCSEVLYDFDLMEGGGHAKAWLVPADLQAGASAALEKLADEQPLLFAVGDGNHSLASAKAHWENIRAGLSDEEKLTHPARYALAEIVNIHDKGLDFEPIHRVVFDVSAEEFVASAKEFFKDAGIEINSSSDDKQSFVVVSADGEDVKISLSNPPHTLAVGSVQMMIDSMGLKCDYIHGEDSVRKLAVSGNTGILVPAISKDTFFATVEKEGVFPRKTFSMGEAFEKRFYLEAKIIE